MKFLLPLLLFFNFSVLGQVSTENVSDQTLNNSFNQYKVNGENSTRFTVIAANRYANKSKRTGYPSFIKNADGSNEVILISGMSWRDISQNDLIHWAKGAPSLDDPKTWHRAVNRWADNFGHMGIPTFDTGKNGVRGAHIIKLGKNVRFLDVPEAELHKVEPNFKLGVENEYEVWARAAHLWAQSKGYSTGIANFEIGVNRVHGVYVFLSDCKNSYQVYSTGGSGRGTIRIKNNHPNRTIVVSLKQAGYSWIPYTLSPGKAVQTRFVKTNSSIIYDKCAWAN